MTNTKSRLAEVREKVRTDTASVKNGVYTVRRSFYYTSGYTSDDLAAAVKKALPGATVLESGEVWKAFRGSAPVAQQSHWFVKFTL